MSNSLHRIYAVGTKFGCRRTRSALRNRDRALAAAVGLGRARVLRAAQARKPGGRSLRRPIRQRRRASVPDAYLRTRTRLLKSSVQTRNPTGAVMTRAWPRILSASSTARLEVTRI